MALRNSVPRLLARSSLLVLAVAAVAVTAIWVARPARPDLDDPGTWTLTRATGSSAGDVRVYSFRHDSTTWDPYDVRQNKILISPLEGGPEKQFMWTSSDPFAGSWCEVVDTGGGAIHVILLDGENAARVVAFRAGRFAYRPKRDELLSPCPLRFLADELPRRVVLSCVNRSPERAWVWTPAEGFVAVEAASTPR